MKKKTLYIVTALFVFLNIGKSYSQRVITTSIEKFVLAQLEDNNVKSKLSDKIVVDEFIRLLKKPKLTLSERILVTKIIDELFPGFVDSENNKIWDLILKTKNKQLQKDLLGVIDDVNVTDENVAALLKKALGIEISPESVRLIRNREPQFATKK